MVRYSLYQGGCRLIFASDTFFVCGKICMLYCFTGMICVSVAVVGDNGGTLSGRPHDTWHIICRIFFALKARLLQSLLVTAIIVISWSMDEVFAHS